MCRWRMSLKQKYNVRIGNTLLVLFMAFVLGASAYSDIVPEFQMAGGYTNNLKYDSSDIEDSFEKAKLTLNLYPFSSFKIDASDEFMVYNETSDLTNNKVSVNATFVPPCEDEHFTFYVNGGFSNQIYDEGYESFNNNNFNINAALGYRINDWLLLRSGCSFNSTDYTNEEIQDTATVNQTFDISGDNETLELYFGGNISLPFSNVIDFEGGYSKMNLTYANPPQDTILRYWDDFTWIKRDYLNPNKDTLVDGNLKSYYFSPRISRPIGSKFGINVVYIYRTFDAADNVIIAGLSNQFLSPWTSVYEGESVTATLKSYIVPNFIITCGAGYWKKDFLKGEEEREPVEGIPPPPRVIKDRHDEQNKFFLSIQKPFPFRSGLFVEPSMEMNISHNNSSNDLYDYNNFGISLGLTIRY